MRRILNPLIFLGILVVFFLSWLPNPDIGSTPLLPKTVGRWIDENYNFRTAIPFFILGVLADINIRIDNKQFFQRVYTCSMLIGSVFVAEVGQLYLPKRHFDWADIGFGIAGSMLGMFTCYVFNRLRNSFLQKALRK